MTGPVETEELTFREGTAADLFATFALSARARHEAAAMRGLTRAEDAPTDDDLAAAWRGVRPLSEFLAARPDGAHWLCCDGEGLPVGCARVVRFAQMQELTDLAVRSPYWGRGIARELLARCWPEDPTPELGRVTVAGGGLADLSVCIDFGTMPVAGSWLLTQGTDAYLERRAQEVDAPDQAAHVLTADRAVAEWKRLEPPAIAHERHSLHEFFGRDRTCLACVDEDSEQATALCWLGAGGEIGPAVGETSEALVPVVLAALDRVAKAHEPGSLSVTVSTISWWLLRRLRKLGFRVAAPGWVLCSVPLPGLDRYMPTSPAQLL
jgi:GNAT superfamily N-acetyltransferase